MTRSHQDSSHCLRSFALVAIMMSGTIAAGCGDKKGNGGTGGTAAGGTSGAGGSAGAAGSGAGGSAGAGAGGSAGSAGSGAGGSAGSAGSGTGGSAGSAGSAGGSGGIIPISCEVSMTAATLCNDGMDNDGDGKTDLADPECVHPCDNDEATFGTGISGDNMDACKQDCFFDGDSGQGNDGCNWDLACDPASPGANAAKPCPYDPNKMNCPTSQSAKCVKNCQKMAPNGCDCFGCCAVQVAGAIVNVRLGSGCTADKFGDPMVCARCTPSTTCVNPCDKCEVCLGRPAPTDPSCAPTPPDGGPGTDGGSTDGGNVTPMCPANVTSCGPGGQVAANACPAGYYCQTGCCVSIMID